MLLGGAAGAGRVLLGAAGCRPLCPVIDTGAGGAPAGGVAVGLPEALLLQ